MTMTIDRKKLRELVGAAPDEIVGVMASTSDHVVYTSSCGRSFYAAARSAVPALLDEIERLERELKTARVDGENEAYKQVYNSARRVAAHPENDASDCRAVMTFAERFRDRALLT